MPNYLVLALESALAVFGIRSVYEQPSYDVVERIGPVEIRRYGPRLAAEATVTAESEAKARDQAFRILSSSSMVGQQMAVSFGIKLDDSLVNGAVEVIRAGEGLMSEVMPLQVAPDPFNIVQLRGVFRQPLDREPVGARREGSAACLTRVDRAVVEDKHDGLEHYPELGTVAPINLLQQSNEVRASFGPAGAHDELATSPIEHAEHRYFGALARGRNAQVGPLLGPDVRQIRMGERFGLV